MDSSTQALVWQCSYQGGASEHEKLAAYVCEQAAGILDFLKQSPALSRNQAGLLVDLQAHEFQHQGQMIRYLYGNKLAMPKSWRQFWSLEP